MHHGGLSSGQRGLFECRGGVLDAERFGGSVDGTGYRFGFSRVDFFLDKERRSESAYLNIFNYLEKI